MRRELRLRNGKDFAGVYDKGKSKANKYLVLYYLYLDTAVPTKVGFSISKKVGSAVARNKLKRRLGEVFVEQFEIVKPGYLMVFIVRRSAVDLDFQQLKAAACDLFKKSGVLGRSSCA